MRRSPLKKTPLSATLAPLLVLALVQSAGVAGETRVVTIEGKAVTGFNRRFGKPIYKYPFAPPPLQTVGFEMLAGHNPDGAAPLRLTDDSPGRTLRSRGVWWDSGSPVQFPPGANLHSQLHWDLAGIPFSEQDSEGED